MKNDINHLTSTDPHHVLEALLDMDAAGCAWLAAQPSSQAAADDLIEGAAKAGITVSDESREALIVAIEASVETIKEEATAAIIGSIEVNFVVAGATGAGGWDADVEVTIDGKAIEGEVTLLPSQQDGTPSSWGQPANWLSGGLLAKILGRDDSREILSAIEAAAVEAIKASDVEAANGR